jgi:signal transduction histidine kinase
MRNFLRQHCPGSTWLWAILLFLPVLYETTVYAEADPPYVFTVDAALEDSLILDKGWRYHAGDDPAWADPYFDDSDWETTGTQSLDSIPGGWIGIGWFRLHLEIDSLLWNTSVGMLCEQSGASDIYLDGRLVRSYGQVGHTPEEEETYLVLSQPTLPTHLNFDRPSHVLAVRYSHHQPNELITSYFTAGFRLQLSDYAESSASALRLLTQGLRHQMLFTGMALIFFLLHFMMYLFYPRLKANLCYALFTAAILGLAVFPGQLSLTHSPTAAILYFVTMSISIIATCVLGLWFLYTLFHNRIPRQFWIILGAGAILTRGSYNLSRNVIYVYAILCLVETLRIVVMAMVRKKEESWIIGIGYLLFIIACTYQMLRDMEVVGLLIEDFYFEYMYGILALLVSMSIYLARQFSRINKDLGEQLVQVKELSARAIEQERQAKEQDVTRKLLEQDIEHKKKELEEAKKLEKALTDLEQANRHLRDTQSQLVQSEKMASMGMLVAGVAHEINTPVGAIGSMHNTLIRAIEKLKEAVETDCANKTALKHKLRENLGVIDQANKVIESGTDRVTNIVRRLRSFARLDEAELVKANINEGIEDTLTLVHHELKHDIEVTREFGDIPEINCYAGQLNQVFLNLIINAKQAIEGKGWIKIMTAVKDDTVLIEISDSGAGIPQESLDRIFDPGFTTKGVKVGTGLGLSICYRIIESHMGEIKVRSNVGEGTTFTISLPMNLNRILENE